MSHNVKLDAMSCYDVFEIKFVRCGNFQVFSLIFIYYDMKTSTAVTITGATVAASILGYAVYFDYRRRNDVNFRRKLGAAFFSTM